MKRSNWDSSECCGRMQATLRGVVEGENGGNGNEFMKKEGALRANKNPAKGTNPFGTFLVDF